MASGPKQAAHPPPEPEQELSEAQVDAFISRNREALDESIRQAREQFARGEVSKRTIADIIADGRRRHGGG